MAKLKDPFSSISHWVGFGLAILGVIVLAVVSWGKPLHFTGFMIYGLCLMALYLASATYHTFHGTGWWKGGLQKLDHASIYLMIAGSYVPVCLIALKGPWGTGLLIAQTLMAVTGVVLTFILKRVPGAVRVVLYVFMGWMAVLALGPMRAVWPPQAIAWLFAEGIVFTVGAAIYVLDKPNLLPGRFSAHDLWHCFVMAGSACHFVLMLHYVAPMA